MYILDLVKCIYMWDIPSKFVSRFADSIVTIVSITIQTVIGSLRMSSLDVDFPYIIFQENEKN